MQVHFAKTFQAKTSLKYSFEFSHEEKQKFQNKVIMMRPAYCK